MFSSTPIFFQNIPEFFSKLKQVIFFSDFKQNIRARFCPNLFSFFKLINIWNHADFKGKQTDKNYRSKWAGFFSSSSLRPNQLLRKIQARQITKNHCLFRANEQFTAVSYIRDISTNHVVSISGNRLNKLIHNNEQSHIKWAFLKQENADFLT